MQKNIYIEVGANWGTHTPQFVKENSMLYCFEPVQECYRHLVDTYKHHDNVMVLPFAIDTVSGIRKFNVSNVGDWGTSGFYEFTDNLDELWPGRVGPTAFTYTDAYNVFTIRLDQFCTLYGIDHVDYLWIDAQGHDLEVLKSLGDMISIVREGSCEAARTLKIYKDTDNDYTTISKYLTDKGFEVGGCSHDQYECDLHFQQHI